jgi:hypothetical protein
VLLGGALSAAGFARVYLTNGSLLNSSAIALSVLGIVTSSCLLGSGLPFLLARAGVDPANAGTSIQVGRRPASGRHVLARRPWGLPHQGRCARLWPLSAVSGHRASSFT